MSQTVSKPDRKAKKSFTLSIESVVFLEQMRKKNRAESVSAILEDILQKLRKREKLSAIERETAQYYDSLSDAQVAEQKRWAQFALEQFPHEDRD